MNPGNSAQRSRISSSDGNFILTNDTDHTILGSSWIGLNNMGGVNKETIVVNNTAAPLYINPNAMLLDNQGTLRADSGATLAVLDGLKNYGSGTLTGGTYYAVGTIKLPVSTADIVTNAATIVMDGRHPPFSAMPTIRMPRRALQPMRRPETLPSRTGGTSPRRECFPMPGR
ncbi:MAG: hypothetical protein RBR16_05015 [Syntrophus sp. (in: bacteria)]|nr:hypothetical protein [Syntrophus sp. (in: bacteria)]